MSYPANIPKHKFTSSISLVPQHHQIGPLINKGLALHQQGKFKEAQTIYEQVLAIQANHFDTLKLLGVLFVQTKQFTKAVDFFTKALQINSNNPACYSNLGVALKELKLLEKALFNYEKAINIKPDFAEAYSNRGVVLQELGRLDEALASCEKAIYIKSDYADAYYNHGLILYELMRLEEALVSYDTAINIKLDYVDAYFNRGNVLQKLGRIEEALVSYDQVISLKSDYVEAYTNRGIILQELGRIEEALLSYDQAISFKPDYADAYSNRGNVLQELGRIEEALLSYDQAISVKSDYADAYSNRGNALQKLGRIKEALFSYDQALSFRPDYAEAYSNRGVALQDLGRVEEALFNYKQSISFKPDYAESHWNLSLCNLLVGNFKDGLQGYEWRWKRLDIIKTTGVRSFEKPLWLGRESLKDKTILLYAEQGFGDTIQYIRYVTLVAQLGAKVILEVQHPLVNLLKNIEGVSQIFAQRDTLPVFDFQCPLSSLPLAFKTELHTIPSVSHHITSCREKVAKWQTKLGEKANSRVGLVWTGSTGHKKDYNRSITLAKLISHLPSNFDYVCLQKEIRDIDKELLAKHNEIKYFSNLLEDFTDTAALCELMDVVISVDTSVAHLAGTLGKPTWVLLSFSPDWRWLLDRDDSPWYPSVKLYRQENIGNWDGVLEKVKLDLKKLPSP